MSADKFSRRDILRGGAATGAGLALAGTGLGAFADDKPAPLDLPVGSSGTLSVIHRTEYFPEAQDLFQASVQAFADANKIKLDSSTTKMRPAIACARPGRPCDTFHVPSPSTASQSHRCG